MTAEKKKLIYLVTIAALILSIILGIVFAALKSPKSAPAGTGVTVIDRNEDTGQVTIRDVYDGDTIINNYDYPLNTYRNAGFVIDDKGIASYEDKSVMGIMVSSLNGDIDWASVKSSGVDYAMIRVGFRGYSRGTMYPDTNFEANIEGAIENGIDVGVYYYSAAVITSEAELEAQEVLDKIRPYKIKYPVAFVWEFKRDAPDGKVPRTQNATPSEVTSFADAFCNIISKANYTPAIYADKDMAYEYYNWGSLKNYQIWYAEYRKAPCFYYDFKMWQYTNQGKVEGIAGNVKLNISLVDYK